MRYFDEPVGRVKIQTTSKNIQRYYTPKRLIRDLLSNDFFSQNSDFAKVLNFTRPGGMRRVQISCDICTRFARYLYSTKQTWIIKAKNQQQKLHLLSQIQTLNDSPFQLLNGFT